jgi:hypothetical protein
MTYEMFYIKIRRNMKDSACINWLIVKRKSTINTCVNSSKKQPYLPIGSSCTQRNNNPAMLFTKVRTRFVTPSATGYVTSHAISKNNGDAPPRKTFAMM